MVSVRWQPVDLRLHEPFTISRGTELVAENVLVTLQTDEGVVGYGEAAPSSHYGERRSSVLAFLQEFAGSLRTDPLSTAPLAMETLHRRLAQVAHLNPAARAAIDMAAYDLLGKMAGLPVATLLGGDLAETPRTSFTIGIDTPERMAAKTRAASHYPILKVKVGTPHDIENLAAVRSAAPHAIIRVDANAAWTPRQAIRMIREIDQFGIEFVEQPVADHDLAGLRLVRQQSVLPIYADESCIVPADVPRVADCVDGINIKLMKCGGLYPAVQMVHLARAHNLRVMLGCMIESSVAITAAAHLSTLVDVADLDGHLLLAHGDDPFVGVQVIDGRLMLSTAPGLGVTPSAA